jgi:hypothetical protein
MNEKLKKEEEEKLERLKLEKKKLLIEKRSKSIFNTGVEKNLKEKIQNDVFQDIKLKTKNKNPLKFYFGKDTSSFVSDYHPSYFSPTTFSSKLFYSKNSEKKYVLRVNKFRNGYFDFFSVKDPSKIKWDESSSIKKERIFLNKNILAITRSLSTPPFIKIHNSSSNIKSIICEKSSTLPLSYFISKLPPLTPTPLPPIYSLSYPCFILL